MYEGANNSGAKPNSSPVSVTKHARERFVERVSGYETVSDALSDGVFSSIENLDEVITNHFEASLPCTLCEDRSQPRRKNVHARIHPGIYTVWIWGEKWPDSHVSIEKELITCYPWAPISPVSLRPMRACEACYELYYPVDTDSCPFCDTDCDASSDATAVLGRWHDTTTSVVAGRWGSTATGDTSSAVGGGSA